MGLIENSMEDIRKSESPTPQEAMMLKQESMKLKIEQMRRVSEKFMASLIDFVEKAVMAKRKVVYFPISNREDIAKLRHLIKRISKNMGYKVNSVKKRWVIVEGTKFVVDTKSNFEKIRSKGKNK